MLLRISFIFILVLSFVSVIANDSTYNWKEWTKSWKKKEINTFRINVKRERNLIKEIEVLDFRSDTTRAGIYTNDFHHPCEVVFDTPIDDLLNKKLSTDTAGETILLVLRSFWINEVQYIEGKPKVRQPVTGTQVPSSKLTCSIDAFIKYDRKYMPLAQVDSIFTDKRKVTNSCRNLTENALAVIEKKLEESVLSKKYLSKKQTNKEFIINIYSRRFKISALTDTAFQKGIYYTWDQFKNNQPSEKEFYIKTNKNEPPSLFVKENGNEVLTRNVFAISDGKNTYKIHQGFVFPIYRNNNSIYWPGLENYDLKTYSAPVGSPLGGGWYTYGLEAIGTNMKIRVTPYLLNVETGKEY